MTFDMAEESRIYHVRLCSFDEIVDWNRKRQESERHEVTGTILA